MISNFQECGEEEKWGVARREDKTEEEREKKEENKVGSAQLISCAVVVNGPSLKNIYRPLWT